MHYLNDVNAGNRTDAASLICSALVDNWKNTIDQQNGDFTVRIVKATYLNYRSATDGIQLSYSLDVTPAGGTTSGSNTATPAASPVTFTVVHEVAGLRICGES